MSRTVLFTVDPSLDAASVEAFFQEIQTWDGVTKVERVFPDSPDFPFFTDCYIRVGDPTDALAKFHADPRVMRAYEPPGRTLIQPIKSEKD